MSATREETDGVPLCSTLSPEPHDTTSGRHRLSCVQPKGHYGDHCDALGETWPDGQEPEPHKMRRPVRMCVQCATVTDMPVMVRMIEQNSGPGWSVYGCPTCAPDLLSADEAWRMLLDHGITCAECRTAETLCPIGASLEGVHRVTRERTRRGAAARRAP